MLKKYLVFLSFVLFISSTAFAQGGDGPPQPKGGPGGSGVPPPDGTPIDGGLGILLAVGVGYAVTKLKKED